MAINSLRALAFAAKTLAAGALRGVATLLAPLGGWGDARKEKKQQQKREVRVLEPVSQETISRLRDEMLSHSLSVDLARRAQQQRNEALLLLLI